MRGDASARHNIGATEYNSGNYEVGIRHFKIAAEAGHQPSLNTLRRIYNAGGKLPGKSLITKDYMDKVYRLGHKAQQDEKSKEREKHDASVGELARAQLMQGQSYRS